MVRRRAAFILLIIVSGFSGAAWERLVPGTSTLAGGNVRAIAVDHDGNVIAAGAVRNAQTMDDFAVAKFDGVSGEPLWIQQLTNPINSFDVARDVEVDAAGDVLAVGEIGRISDADNLSVVKLHGETGAELWRAHLGPFDAGRGRAVRIDAAGNVVVVGSLRTPHGMFVVVKLDGASGSELWRRHIVGTSTRHSGDGSAVSVDADGNVLAAGEVENADTEIDFTVVKLDGHTGNELWRQTVNGVGNGSFDTAYSVGVDTNGDVVAAGGLDGGGIGFDAFIIKFDGTNGTEEWRYTRPTPGLHEWVAVATFDPAGNVVALGTNFSVTRLDGATGHLLWEQTPTVEQGRLLASEALAVDSHGHVVAGGVIDFSSEPSIGLTIKYDATTGSEIWRNYVGSGAVSAASDAENHVLLGLDGEFAVKKLNGGDGADFSSIFETPIDIRPRTAANIINLGDGDAVPVAILRTELFDPATMDPATIRFGPTGTEATPIGLRLEDVDGDGDEELVARFRIADTGIQCGDTAAVLTGLTLGNKRAVTGTDRIRTRGC